MKTKTERERRLRPQFRASCGIEAALFCQRSDGKQDRPTRVGRNQRSTLFSRLISVSLTFRHHLQRHDLPLTQARPDGINSYPAEQGLLMRAGTCLLIPRSLPRQARSKTRRKSAVPRCSRPSQWHFDMNHRCRVGPGALCGRHGDQHQRDETRRKRRLCHIERRRHGSPQCTRAGARRCAPRTWPRTPHNLFGLTSMAITKRTLLAPDARGAS